MTKLSRQEIARQLFRLANMLAGEETGHLAGTIHGVVSEIWEIDKKNPELFDMPSNEGRLITIAEFKTACVAGEIDDEGGHGVLSTAEKKSDFSVFPSMVQYSMWNFPDWATHVLWIDTSVGKKMLRVFDRASALYLSLTENQAANLRKLIREASIETILYYIQNEFLPGLSDIEAQELFWYVQGQTKG